MKPINPYAVYIHTFPNGKKYVGISSNVAHRFRNGKGYEHQPIMRSAISKYGWKSVTTEIVLQDVSEETAKQEEIRLIAELQTTDRAHGYNQTLGGESAYGRHVSEENKRQTGKRMSEIHKGVPLSEEHKLKISAALKGRTPNISAEGKQRIIQSNRTRVYTIETREKMSQNTKRAMAKKNMSEYLAKRWAEDKEARKAKLRITMYDRYGVIPKNHSLREDVIFLGIDKSEYAELFEDMDAGHKSTVSIKESLREEMNK